MPLTTSFWRTIPVYWDESLEPDVQFYKLYWGTESGIYDAPGSPKNMGNTYFGTFDTEFSGIYYITLTVVDLDDNESGFQDPELIAQIPYPSGLIS